MDALKEEKALRRIYAIFPCKWKAANVREARISQKDHKSIHLHLQTTLIVPAGRWVAQPLATVKEQLKDIFPDR